MFARFYSNTSNNCNLINGGFIQIRALLVDNGLIDYYDKFQRSILWPERKGMRTREDREAETAILSEGVLGVLNLLKRSDILNSDNCDIILKKEPELPSYLHYPTLSNDEFCIVTQPDFDSLNSVKDDLVFFWANQLTHKLTNINFKIDIANFVHLSQLPSETLIKLRESIPEKLIGEFDIDGESKMDSESQIQNLKNIFLQSQITIEAMEDNKSNLSYRPS